MNSVDVTMLAARRSHTLSKGTIRRHAAVSVDAPHHRSQRNAMLCIAYTTLSLYKKDI